MRFFRKFFKLPGPKDLGKADSNYALPSRMFTPDNKEYSWEDWHDEVKGLHPVRYFLSETLPKFWRQHIWGPTVAPIKRAHYWLTSHLIPSRRYHMLDLRQPCTDNQIDCYRYGWRDADNRMLFAIFNLLNQFVEHELSSVFEPTAEEIAAEPSLQSQKDFVLEIKAIHKWWNVDRKIDHKTIEGFQSSWLQAKKNGLPHTQKLWNELQQLDADFDNKTDEMIARLMKIRRSLWT